MAINNTMMNLKRLDSNNLLKLFIYKLKKKIKIKPSKKETDLYIYYSYLVKYNGFLIEETEKHYISDFKRKFPNLLKLRKQPSSDFDVFYQVNEINEYLPVVIGYKINFKNADNYFLNIIDAGCNIGLTSLFFTEHFESARIIAVEPDKGNFQTLNYNLKEKTNFEYIKINGAVWSTNSKIKVINDFRDRSDWSFRVEESDDSNSLQAYTINHLATTNNFEYIDYLRLMLKVLRSKYLHQWTQIWNF
jgi:FkbM family methyltransferase